MIDLKVLLHELLLTDISTRLEGAIRELIEETKSFYDYDDHIFQYDHWMQEVAFPQFEQVFRRYEECAVDVVSFGRDLDDFKAVLGAVKRQETEYYESMNELIEGDSVLNSEMEKLFSI